MGNKGPFQVSQLAVDCGKMHLLGYLKSLIKIHEACNCSSVNISQKVFYTAFLITVFVYTSTAESDVMTKAASHLHYGLLPYPYEQQNLYFWSHFIHGTINELTTSVSLVNLFINLFSHSCFHICFKRTSLYHFCNYIDLVLVKSNHRIPNDVSMTAKGFHK